MNWYFEVAAVAEVTERARSYNILVIMTRGSVKRWATPS